MNQLQFYRRLVILNGAVPLLMLVWDAYHGQLGVNSVNYALHVTGILSLVSLFVSLLMTPLRWITGWGGWIAFRRALGLYGFFYSVLHVAIYVGFDRALNVESTLHEIWTRRFLQIGTAAVFLMVPLAVTSTNSMIRIIGSARWKRLHQLAYVVAILGVVHYYLLVKSDVRQPLAFAAVLSLLLLGRFGRHYFELRKAAKKSKHSPSPAKGRDITAVPARPVVAAGEKPPQAWKGELRVSAIFQETHDVKTFRLTSPEGGSLPFAYLPGQFLNLQMMIDGKRVNRSYTIASSPTRSDSCELSIKREPMGQASRYMHDQIRVGDLLKISGPAGKFVFTGHESSAVLLIAGGVGITPVMSILRYLTDRAWSGEIFLLNVVKSDNDLIFRDEIEWLKARFPNLHVCTTLTRCEPNSLWKGERGRASSSLIQRFVPELANIAIFLCGPNPMMDATLDLLINLGVSRSQIKTEAFVSSKARTSRAEEPIKTPSNNHALTNQQSHVIRPVAVTQAKSTMTFARSMIQTEVTSETTVLEAAEASMIELPFECRAGICGQCKTKLIEGNVIMECEDALSASEKANGLILACQSRPLSNIVVDN